MEAIRGLITSQIDTAPKLCDKRAAQQRGLITSQIDTAPKRTRTRARGIDGLITSQIDTAPKLLVLRQLLSEF